MEKPTIFISHISEEAELAALLKRDFNRAFLGLIQVFVSSDGESITAGRDWLTMINGALKDAVIEIVLCSQVSISRPWINFEAGAGWLKGIPVVPVCHTGLQLRMLPMPLSALEAVEAKQVEGLKKIYSFIAKTLGVEQPEIELLRETVERVKRFESDYSARMKKMMASSGGTGYCNVSHVFYDSHKDYFERKIFDKKRDRSDLWYIFINTKLFRECKEIVQQVLEDAGRKARAEGKRLYDGAIWSLLGAAELLVKFRAEDSLAFRIREDLMAALKPPVPIDEDLVESTYIGHSGSLLESTHMNPTGLTMVNIAEEMVLDSSAKRPLFKEGMLFQVKPFPGEMRSIKVFVKLHFTKGFRPENRLGLAARIGGFTDTVETYAVSEHGNGGPEEVVIEAHFPCGRFGELQDLSTELEAELFEGLVKETYLAYHRLPLMLE